MATIDTEPTTKIDGQVFGPIAVTVENDQQKAIEETNIYIHSSRADTNSDDPLFSNISIAAACVTGGFFRTTITENSGSSIFKNSEGVGKWYELIKELFPIDDAKDGSSLDTSSHQLSGKVQVHYDEDEMVIDTLLLSIKTKALFPVTIGTLNLPAVEVDDEEETMFDWLELTISQNTYLANQQNLMKAEIEDLKAENHNLQKSYDQSKTDYESIIQDLETKFYQILNSKKDRIWELLQQINTTASGNDLNGGRIIGLNERFEKSRNRLKNIDIDKIKPEIDEKYVQKKKEPLIKKREASKKRIRVKKEKGDGIPLVKKRGRPSKRKNSISDDENSSSDRNVYTEESGDEYEEESRAKKRRVGLTSSEEGDLNDEENNFEEDQDGDQDENEEDQDGDLDENEDYGNDQREDEGAVSFDGTDYEMSEEEDSSTQKDELKKEEVNEESQNNQSVELRNDSYNSHKVDKDDHTNTKAENDEMKDESFIDDSLGDRQEQEKKSNKDKDTDVSDSERDEKAQLVVSTDYEDSD